MHYALLVFNWSVIFTNVCMFIPWWNVTEGRVYLNKLGGERLTQGGAECLGPSRGLYVYQCSGQK